MDRYGTFGKALKKKWVMIDWSHPLFNVWRCEIETGNSYKECFAKGENPNLKIDWDKADRETKVVYAKKCMLRGENISSAANRVGISYQAMRNYYGDIELNGIRRGAYE